MNNKFLNFKIIILVYLLLGLNLFLESSDVEKKLENCVKVYVVAKHRNWNGGYEWGNTTFHDFMIPEDTTIATVIELIKPILIKQCEDDNEFNEIIYVVGRKKNSDNKVSLSYDVKLIDLDIYKNNLGLTVAYTKKEPDETSGTNSLSDWIG